MWARTDKRLAERAMIVEKEIRRLTAEKLTGPDGLERTFGLLKRGPELYDLYSDETRAILLKAVASNCIVTAENIVVNYRKPFDKVRECVVSRDWLGLVDLLRTHISDLSAREKSWERELVEVS
jgi:hypothetical protein